MRPLTEKGMADRAIVTEYLRDKRITAFYSSPYKRAYDTVVPAAEALGLSITTVDDFRERRVGTWIDDFEEFVRLVWRDHDYAHEGGESLNEVKRRNIAALTPLIERHDGECIAIGTHGAALSSIIHHYRPSFGLDDFMAIVSVNPWIVRMAFDGDACVEVTYRHDMLPE